MYPTLQLLEDEGVVRSETREGKRVYELTDAGQAQVAARTDAGEGPPWEVVGNDGVAVRILSDARKELYLLLAGD